MEEAGYYRLKKKKRTEHSPENSSSQMNNISNFHMSNISPPKDNYNIIYLSFVLGGAGFLFPYNSFIMAMDFFKNRYSGAPVVFDMSLIYISTAFATVLTNNFLVESYSLTARINFGYIISFFTLIFVVTCEVYWEVFGAGVSYMINLVAVATVAVGCTVQQSSFYGYTSMLPAKYTQALMVGESVSGVFTSIVRVVTKLLITEIVGSTVYFFLISIISVACCFIGYHAIRKSDFIQFYIALFDRAKTKIVLEPTEDGSDPADLQYGMLRIQNSPPANTSLSFTNPLYEPAAKPLHFKVEDFVVRGRCVRLGGMPDIKRGFQARIVITKQIYPYMISIGLVYFVTLCLYPGLASEIVSCRLGSWMPILMMAIFNGADLLGKLMFSSTSIWSERKLIRWSLLRILLIPMMLMCTVPLRDTIFTAEIFAFSLSLLIGLTNGILGSIPMIQAPSKVADYNKELTGNLMTLMYNFGLISGSLMGYLIQSLLPTMDDNHCGFITIQPTTVLPFVSTILSVTNQTEVIPTTNFTSF
ncbi:PREDICTED: equilibrative nucleoside transporter 4 [Nicrophorus vespilloides]|uniref:Equilibrative nucleoside transporter 4 n=1 Tax=Nicrophorus vespilloides TaxID=110193 RepID=A0ABM1MH10_NICVS|nr:PREDICTED: equilibrative nucleoside transporter 4 [Nicrophorus vespilloides]